MVITFLAVLYGFETWYFISRKEHENSGITKIFAPEEDELLRILHE